MKKYWTVFKNSWQRTLDHRFDFLIGRLQSIVVMLVLYFLWMSLALREGRFGDYESGELATYVFAAMILRAFVFGSRPGQVAAEINEGIFSKYLTMPVNYFWFNFMRDLAPRIIYFISSVLEISLFVFLVKAEIILVQSWKLAVLFLISVALAMFVYYCLGYLVSLVAFWSREAMGPRFLFEWFLEFASGAFFPLNILSGPLYVFLTFLPFAYLIYFPASLYLGRFDCWQILTGILIQMFFAVILGFFARFVWQRGLKRYSGEGI